MLVACQSRRIWLETSVCCIQRSNTFKQPHCIQFTVVCQAAKTKRSDIFLEISSRRCYVVYLATAYVRKHKFRRQTEQIAGLESRNQSDLNQGVYFYTPWPKHGKCKTLIPQIQYQLNDQWRQNEFESGGGAPIRRKAPGIFLFVVPLHFFGSKSTISSFGERFRDGQYSLVSFLFAVLLLTVSPLPSYM